MNHLQPKYLFDCLDDVRGQLAHRDKVAVFLDLDGTLASITPTPKMTRLKPHTRVALRDSCSGRALLRDDCERPGNGGPQKHREIVRNYLCR